MMTQHPDSASRYVSVRDEPAEAIDALTPQPVGLGLEEVMVDYEGKLTPYHQTAEIALGLRERGLVPGRDIRVTPRIPSSGKETVFHQLMALMSVIESNYQMSSGGEGSIFEVVVPMVETAGELVDVRRRIEDVIELGHKEFGIPRDPDAVQVIPLVEEVPELLAAGRMVSEYLDRAGEAGYGVRDLRLMLGRSDSAMVYGMVPSILAAKVAISDCYQAVAGRCAVHPILGGGVLPFRGHVSLGNLEQLAGDFPGVRTITVQSGLRYDCGSEAARQVALRAGSLFAGGEPLSFEREQRDEITAFVGIFTRHYLESFALMMDPLIALSDLIPPRRDRLARKSAVGYARDAAQPAKLASFISDAEIAGRLAAVAVPAAENLPRAISFTGALYSIGLPPEFIGTGRGLAEIEQRYGRKGRERLLDYHPGLVSDLEQAARFANLETAAGHLAPELMEQLRMDFSLVEEHLGVRPGPLDRDDQRYNLLLETLQPMMRQLVSGDDWGGETADRELVAEWICRLGRLRGSLG
jgi:phosphoenolpyruvate carboxylase